MRKNNDLFVQITVIIVSFKCKQRDNSFLHFFTLETWPIWKIVGRGDHNKEQRKLWVYDSPRIYLRYKINRKIWIKSKKFLDVLVTGNGKLGDLVFWSLNETWMENCNFPSEICSILNLRYIYLPFPDIWDRNLNSPSTHQLLFPMKQGAELSHHKPAYLSNYAVIM